MKNSKDDLVQNGGYDEIVIEDFYESFNDALQSIISYPLEYEEWLSSDD